jgi:hypothetical protein
MNTLTDSSQQPALPPIEGYPAIEVLLEDYKRRATIRVRRIRIGLPLGAVAVCILWPLMDGGMLRALLIMAYLGILIPCLGTLGWAKRIASPGSTAGDDFVKALLSQSDKGEVETMLKDLEGEIESGYVCIKGTYLTKSYLIRLGFDSNDQSSRELIIIRKLSSINRAEIRNFNNKRVGPSAGSGPKNVTLEFKDTTFRLCFWKSESRSELIKAIIERRPDFPIAE